MRSPQLIICVCRCVFQPKCLKNCLYAPVNDPSDLSGSVWSGYSLPNTEHIQNLNVSQSVRSWNAISAPTCPICPSNHLHLLLHPSTCNTPLSPKGGALRTPELTHGLEDKKKKRKAKLRAQQEEQSRGLDQLKEIMLKSEREHSLHKEKRNGNWGLSGIANRCPNRRGGDLQEEESHGRLQEPLHPAPPANRIPMKSGSGGVRAAYQSLLSFPHISTDRSTNSESDRWRR